MNEARGSSTKRIGIGECIRAFLNRESAYAGTLQTTGGVLFSYLYPLAKWNDNRIVVAKDVGSQCMTTRKHCKILRGMATTLGIEVNSSH